MVRRLQVHVSLHPRVVDDRPLPAHNVLRRVRERRVHERLRRRLGRVLRRAEQAAPRALLCELFLQLAEEHAGQRADPFGLQEIVLHEPLDRGLALPVGEVHPPRDSLLQIEGQPIFRPPGDFVEETEEEVKYTQQEKKVITMLLLQQRLVKLRRLRLLMVVK